MGCTLGAVEPLNVPQPTSDLALLELLLGDLLLLLGLELHVTVVLGTRVDSRRDGRGGRSAGDAGSGATVLESVERDGRVAALGHPAIVDVPLLGAQSAHKLLVMGN